MSGIGDRVRSWRPPTPPLPGDLAALVRPDDPEWFARELAVAAAPPWWFWRLLVRWSPLLPAIAGWLEVTGSVPAAERGRRSSGRCWNAAAPSGSTGAPT